MQQAHNRYLCHQRRYDATNEISITFFQTVQNKNALGYNRNDRRREIHNRADADKPNMGLTNWRSEKVRKEDVAIAKNYLNEEELSALNKSR